jgi:hypothetical protein
MMMIKEKTWQKNLVSFFLKGKQFLHLVVLPALLLMFCKKVFLSTKAVDFLRIYRIVIIASIHK